MRSVIIAVALVAAILSIGGSNGCDTSSQNNELTHMPEWATDMMRIVPRNATIAAFWDIRTIRSNAVLQDYYASKKSVYEAITDLDMFVGFNQLDYWAVAKDLSLVKGNFNLVDITESLGNNGWVSDEYEGIEVWTNEEMEGDLIALFSDYIITGTEESVTEAIETFNGDHPSLYEDDQFRSLMTRLPSGFFISYRENDFDITLAPSEVIYEGYILDIVGSNTARTVHVATTTNTDVTEDYMQNLMKDMEQYEEYDQLDIQISRDGEYIKLTVVGPIPVTLD